jgi:formate hydrogenlyase subunit 3/multisubunit Na+/H+ antiporter MnhD subunit
MNELLYPIVIPFIAGIAILFIPNRVKFLKEAISVIISALVLVLAVRLFIVKPLSFTVNSTLLLFMDNLSGFIALFVAFFGLLAVIYSLGFMKGKDNLNQYYAYILMTIGASIGAVLANDLIFFMACWGFLGLTLYLLINLGGPDAAYASKKTLVIVGGADALMILGISIIMVMAKTFSIKNIYIPLNNGLAILAFLSLACGAFAKAGVMPLHTWIPASSEVAPTSVMGFLPASLDKLLGIYLLARLSMDVFIIRPDSPVSILLLALGAITVLAAVMMALVQHDLKRLLAYHAVSQVGYMVLGIGTGNPIGIAGGLFHMLNNSIYKYALFLCGGAVEQKKGTTDLHRLGGLSKTMPITYISCLIAALAISGVPPLNGFVSKWMVYQGLIELGRSGGRLWVIWVVAAIFGSALTLASFMKLTHATFLGQCPGPACKRDEVGPSMWVPTAILAALCIIFGIFAYQIPIKLFIGPSVRRMITYPGVWNASLSTGLILVGILIGFIIYAVGSIRNIRVDEPFIGGEPLRKDMKVSGVEFYKTIEEMPFLSKLYKLAKTGVFDIYNVFSNFVFFCAKGLKALHNGVLPTYLAWCLIGAIILFFVMR